MCSPKDYSGTDMIMVVFNRDSAGVDEDAENANHIALAWRMVYTTHVPLIEAIFQCGAGLASVSLAHIR